MPNVHIIPGPYKTPSGAYKNNTIIIVTNISPAAENTAPLLDPNTGLPDYRFPQIGSIGIIQDSGMWDGEFLYNIYFPGGYKPDPTYYSTKRSETFAFSHSELLPIPEPFQSLLAAIFSGYDQINSFQTEAPQFKLSVFLERYGNSIESMFPVPYDAVTKHLIAYADGTCPPRWAITETE